jgi:hypothetical protein
MRRAQDTNDPISLKLQSNILRAPASEYPVTKIIAGSFSRPFRLGGA